MSSNQSLAQEGTPLTCEPKPKGVGGRKGARRGRGTWEGAKNPYAIVAAHDAAGRPLLHTHLERGQVAVDQILLGHKDVN